MMVTASPSVKRHAPLKRPEKSTQDKHGRLHRPCLSWVDLLLSSPYRLALLQIRLHPFSKIGTAIDAGQHIIEGNDVFFCCTQTSVSFLRRPNRQWSKTADLLRHLKYMLKKALFVDDCREKPTLQGISCREQLPCKQHFFSTHGTK